MSYLRCKQKHDIVLAVGRAALMLQPEAPNAALRNASKIPSRQATGEGNRCIMLLELCLVLKPHMSMLEVHHSFGLVCCSQSMYLRYSTTQHAVELPGGQHAASRGEAVAGWGHAVEPACSCSKSRYTAAADCDCYQPACGARAAGESSPRAAARPQCACCNRQRADNCSVGGSISGPDECLCIGVEPAQP